MELIKIGWIIPLIIIWISTMLLPYPLGADSIYFYGKTCHWNFLKEPELQLLSKEFLQNFPCNLQVFKLLPLLYGIIITIILIKSAEIISPKYAYLAGYASFFVPSFWPNVMQFEDDLIALPYLFLVNYFFLKDQKKFGALLIIFSGLFFWKGAIIYLISYSFFYLPVTIMLFGFVLYNGFDTTLNGFYALIFPQSLVADEQIFLGLTQINLGWFGIFILFQKIYFIIPFFVFALLKAKFLTHFGFWLILGIVALIKILNESQKIKQKIDFQLLKKIPLMCLILSLGFSLAISFSILNSYPQENQLIAIKETIKISQQLGKKINNDWSYGYFLRFYGGNPNNEAGGESFVNYEKNTITLTENYFKECQLVKDFGRGFQNNLKIYNC